MKRFKKKGFWVLYVAIVLAGMFIIVALGLQNQSPVITDVVAQTTPSEIFGYNFYNYTSSNFLGYAGSLSAGYSMPGPFITTLICESPPEPTHFTCTSMCIDGGGTQITCTGGGGYNCGGIIYGGILDTETVCSMRYTETVCDVSVKFSTPTSKTCSLLCSGPSTTMLYCNTTSTICATSINYATSTTCDIKCLGGGSNTLMTCSFGGTCGGNTISTCGSSLFGSCGVIGGNTLLTCIGCSKRKEETQKWGLPYGEVEATRWASCGTWIMHASPGLPTGYSNPPAL